MDTIAAPRMALYRCRSSNFPVYLYNLLMIYRHICSCKALLSNDRSTPMGTICCFSLYDFNNPLRTTHCWSNDPISKTESITLVNPLGLSHCAAWAVSLSIRKLRYYFTYGGSFNDVVGVWWLHLHIQGCTLGRTWVVLVLVPLILRVLVLRFMGDIKDYVSPSLMTSVSIWFMVIR